MPYDTRHLSVSLDDIRRFRQLDSKAPGHPEYHWVSSVETTTGPPGQGVATSVGMAIAEKWLANRYNRPSFEIFNYNIYTVRGDGCLMEGVASEAASLANTCASTTFIGSTATTITPSKETRISPLQKMSQRDFWRMDGTFCEWVLASDAPFLCRTILDPRAQNVPKTELDQSKQVEIAQVRKSFGKRKSASKWSPS